MIYAGEGAEVPSSKIASKYVANDEVGQSRVIKQRYVLDDIAAVVVVIAQWVQVMGHWRSLVIHSSVGCEWSFYLVGAAPQFS